MSEKLSRRSFVKSTVLGASMATAAGMPTLFGVAHGSTQFPPFQQRREIPIGDIAGLKLSRMMLGGNLLTHYTHSRDLRYVYNLAAHYNTPEKILETMRLAEEHGVNAFIIHTAPGVLGGLQEYKRRGGTIKCIICTIAPITEDMTEYTDSCQQCIDAGVDALYLWGVHADNLVVTQPDLIRRAVNTMRSFDVPVGVGCHDLRVVEYCEQANIRTDFYLKTFHHRNYPSSIMNFDSHWCEDPDKVIEVFSKVEKPWIAFKVMAAGAIPPRDALNFTFTHGADFVVFGMFDFEIDENTRIMNEVLAQDSVQNRARKWFG